MLTPFDAGALLWSTANSLGLTLDTPCLTHPTSNHLQISGNPPPNSSHNPPLLCIPTPPCGPRKSSPMGHSAIMGLFYICTAQEGPSLVAREHLNKASVTEELNLIGLTLNLNGHMQLVATMLESVAPSHHQSSPEPQQSPPNGRPVSTPVPIQGFPQKTDTKIFLKCNSL